MFVHLTIRRWLTTFSKGVHLEHMYKCSSRLLECDSVKNRCLWQSHARTKKIRTPQPGKEPGTSQLCFEYSTNWATVESMSFLSILSHYPVTLCDVFVHLTIRWWLITFSTRVHLEHMYKCSSRLLECDSVMKWQYMSLTVSCLEKKDQNSSAGKWTQDLSIKLWVLYQLRLLGNPCLSSPSIVTIQWPYLMCLCT